MAATMARAPRVMAMVETLAAARKALTPQPQGSSSQAHARTPRSASQRARGVSGWQRAHGARWRGQCGCATRMSGTSATAAACVPATFARAWASAPFVAERRAGAAPVATASASYPCSSYPCPPTSLKPSAHTTSIPLCLASTSPRRSYSSGAGRSRSKRMSNGSSRFAYSAPTFTRPAPVPRNVMALRSGIRRLLPRQA